MPRIFPPAEEAGRKKKKVGRRVKSNVKEAVKRRTRVSEFQLDAQPADQGKPRSRLTRALKDSVSQPLPPVTGPALPDATVNRGRPEGKRWRALWTGLSAPDDPGDNVTVADAPATPLPRFARTPGMCWLVCVNRISVLCARTYMPCCVIVRAPKL